jgi:uncharacterized protein
MKDLTLTEIWIYPVKGLGGIRLSSARVFEKGLLHDRRWMLIDDEGIFMTQRAYPQMALFKLSFNNKSDAIIITKKDATSNQSISFNTDTSLSGTTFRTKIWDDEVDVQEVDPKLNEWFSFHFNMNTRLVRFPENNPRPVDSKYKVNNEHVSLADAYPFLIIGQSTLDLLNTKLKHPIPMDRFRPNFVFTGAEPHAEDTWRDFTIGKNRFVGVKLCARCAVPTVNQETAEKGVEPSATLATYRKWDNKIWFGQNVVALDYGHVSDGDKITIN